MSRRPQAVLILVVVGILGFLGAAGPALAEDPPPAGWDDVRAAFALGDLAEARVLADRLAADEPDDDQGLYWRYRLAESPDVARDLRRRLLELETLGPAARALLLQDAAWIAYAAGDYQEALDILADVPRGEHETAATSGLLGGLAQRALGDGERARDALAAVPPDDPDYAWARYRLGQLAHAVGDMALAERYLEMAAEAPDSPCRAEVLLTQWRIARESDPQKAVRLARELDHRFPDSLPAALVAEQEQHRLDLQRSLEETTEDAPPPPAPDVEPPGRYALQFAAFADRARALAFLDAWSDRVPGLHIEPEDDGRGGTLYKLRAGAYPGRSQARDAADDFADRHGLRPIPVQPADGP